MFKGILEVIQILCGWIMLECYDLRHEIKDYFKQRNKANRRESKKAAD